MSCCAMIVWFVDKNASRWGEPIKVEAFAAEKIAAASDGKLDSREVVRVLSAEIEKRLLDLTINAPDW